MTSKGAYFWRRLGELKASDKLIPKLVRFGIVGASSATLFAVVTALLAGPLEVGPKWAALAGYLASMPLNFIGNRQFSFRSDKAMLGQVMRFLLLHMCNILLTQFAMGAAVDFFGLHYGFGILATVVLVPCLSFVIMNLWVFSKDASAQTTHRNS